VADDVIEVDELRLRCVIGISREERRDRQDVVISLRIGTDAHPAAVIDCLGAVWNYRTAAKAIIAHVESLTYLTVEKLASEIARIVVVDHARPGLRCGRTSPVRCGSRAASVWSSTDVEVTSWIPRRFPTARR
jgi:FolB domain-containing protein